MPWNGARFSFSARLPNRSARATASALLPRCSAAAAPSRGSSGSPPARPARAECRRLGAQKQPHPVRPAFDEVRLVRPVANPAVASPSRRAARPSRAPGKACPARRAPRSGSRRARPRRRRDLPREPAHRQAHLLRVHLLTSGDPTTVTFTRRRFRSPLPTNAPMRGYGPALGEAGGERVRRAGGRQQVHVTASWPACRARAVVLQRLQHTSRTAAGGASPTPGSGAARRLASAGAARRQHLRQPSWRRAR